MDDRWEGYVSDFESGDSDREDAFHRRLLHTGLLNYRYKNTVNGH